MAEFLAYRILDGKTTFEKVPARLKDEVKKVLVELGHAELIHPHSLSGSTISAEGEHTFSLAENIDGSHEHTKI